MNILWIIAAVCLACGIVLLLPEPKESKKKTAKRLRRAYGFEKAQQKAKLLGYNFNLKHYIFLLIASIGAGVLTAVFLKNVFFIAVGAVLGFLAPQILLSLIEYRRRREILQNLPTNLRLLASKLLEFRSVETSLEHSLPLMNGITKPYFEHLYNSLVLRLDLENLLSDLRNEIRFQKFDDLCEKLLAGTEDGFHEKAIDSIKESIEDMQSDLQLLKKLDIENQSKIYMLYVVLGGIWSIPILFGLFEKQAGVAQYTIDSMMGKIIIATMAITTLVTLLMKDKYLRLNLNKL